MRTLPSLLLLVVTGIASAQTIEAYNPQPAGPVTSLATQADGKLLVVGNFSGIGGTTRSRVARLNIDGSPDTGFANADVDSDVKTVAVQSDGKVLVGGSFENVGGQPRHYLARLNADGTLDTGFGDPNLDASVWSIAIQPDGKILAGGDFAHAGASARAYVARFGANGNLDATYADPQICCLPVRSVALQNDGRILVGGYFSQVGAASHFYFARFSASGVFDPSFPNVGHDIGAGSIAVAPDGSIYVVELGGDDILKLTANGTPAAGFSSAIADGTLNSIALQPNGQVMISGIFQNVAGQPRHALARLNLDGSLDHSFADLDFSLDSTHPNGYIYGIAEQADGRIIALGNFSLVAGQSRNMMARVATGGHAGSALVVQPSAGTVTATWYRSGVGPELALPPSLEHSTDGSSFTPVGPMTRVANGWRATAPYDVHGARFYLRVIGSTSSGAGNGSPGQVASDIWSSDTIFRDGFD